MNRALLLDFIIALPFVVSFALAVAAGLWYWATHPNRKQKKATTPTERPRVP